MSEPFAVNWGRGWVLIPGVWERQAKLLRGECIIRGWWAFLASVVVRTRLLELGREVPSGGR